MLCWDQGVAVLASQFVDARVRARKEMRRMIGGFMVLELCAGWCAQFSGVQSVMGVLCSPEDRRVPQNVYYGVFLEIRE